MFDILSVCMFNYYYYCNYPVSRETGHPTLAHNFAICWPMFKIL